MAEHLSTAELPELDLLIRTGGEQRDEAGLVLRQALGEALVQGVADAEFQRTGRDARGGDADRLAGLLVRLAGAVWASWQSGFAHGEIPAGTAIEGFSADRMPGPLEIRLPDLVRLGVVDPFEAENEDPKQIAKRLLKMKVVDRYNSKFGLFTMARRADGDCHYLHPKTRRCTVYEQRPDTCRKHPQTMGPRHGYCAYGRREELSVRKWGL